MPTKPITFLSVMSSGRDGGPPAPTNKMDLDRVERLEIYADPYGITINATTTEYIIHLKSKIPGAGIGVSRKILARAEVDRADHDSETYLADHIFNMKYELGWRGMRVSKSYVDGEMRRREQMLKEDAAKARIEAEAAFNASIAFDENGLVVDPVPIVLVKKKAPQCPEHGNALEPREVGVLGCPIEGCTVTMRKKATVGAAFTRSGETVPAPASTIVSKAQTGGFIPPPPMAALVYEDGSIEPILVAAGMRRVEKTTVGTTPDLPIELTRVPGWDGWVLKQGNSIIYLNDECAANVKINQDRTGLTDATVVINVRPTA